MPTTDTRPTCLVHGCEEPVESFKHFPTVVGYCLTHGNVLARFLSLVDAYGPIGLDAARARWEIDARRAGLLGPR